MKKVLKPFWMKFKFWFPIVTGLVTSISFAIKFVFDFEIPTEVLAWLIASGLTLLSVILGVEWSEIDDLQE